MMIIMIMITHRNCLLKHIIEGKIERTGRRRRGWGLKQLLNDINRTEDVGN